MTFLFLATLALLQGACAQHPPKRGAFPVTTTSVSIAPSLSTQKWSATCFWGLVSKLSFLSTPCWICTHTHTHLYIYTHIYIHVHITVFPHAYLYIHAKSWCGTLILRANSPFSAAIYPPRRTSLSLPHTHASPLYPF